MLDKDAITEIDFETVKHYINTGESQAMNERRKELLAVCLDAYGVLAQCPARVPAVRRLMALEEGKGRTLSFRQAARLVDFTRSTWGDYMGTSREFLDAYLCNMLMRKIADPGLDEDYRCRYAALLQRHVAAMPPEKLDPRLVEKNTVNLTLTVNAHSVTLTEKELLKLPQALKEKLLDSAAGELTEDAAAEILEN